MTERILNKLRRSRINSEIQSKNNKQGKVDNDVPSNRQDESLRADEDSRNRLNEEEF